MLLVSFCCLFSLGSQAQKTADIGVLFSPLYPISAAFEYRVPIKKNEKFLLKYGLSHTQHNDFRWYESEIISANDSIVTERQLGDIKNTFAFRFGSEYQIKESVFSIYSDVNIGYRHEKLFYNSMSYQLQDGEWVSPQTTIYPEGEDPSLSRVTRHYLTTNLRAGAAINVPIGKRFLLNVYAGGSFGLPIYMGETNKVGPEEDFKGVPITFDSYTNAGIGLRYKLGVNKE